MSGVTLGEGSGHVEIYDADGAKRIRFSQPQESYTPAELRNLATFLAHTADAAERIAAADHPPDQEIVR